MVLFFGYQAYCFSQFSKSKRAPVASRKIVGFSIDGNLGFKSMAFDSEACIQPKLSPLLERSLLNGLLEQGNFYGDKLLG
jgi:hypothetical protein